MNNIHWHRNKILAIPFLISCIISTLWIPFPAQADVGVQPVLPGGSNIQPEQETPIQMKAETVTMTVRAATEADNAAVNLNPDAYGYNVHRIWFPGMAEVQADFTMHNPTSNPVNMTVWFPLASALENVDWNFNPDETVPRITNFRVIVNENSVQTTTSELPNPKGADKPDLPWASFPVTFAANADTLIQVRYTLPLQPSIKGNEMALYYVFQTGAGWAGSIGSAKLIVNLPYPASTGTMTGIQPGHFTLPYMSLSSTRFSLPAGGVLEGNQARWSWQNFEPGPEDDFAVWLLRVDRWQAMETARSAVNANPQDGMAWLNLAIEYHTLSALPRRGLTAFSGTYLKPAIEAYRRAADLLPQASPPHAGLALLTLAPYMAERNAPAGVMQTVMDEYKTALTLEEKDPWTGRDRGTARFLLSWLEEDMNMYNFNNATATSDAATQAGYNATYTAQATIEYATHTARSVAEATLMKCYPTDNKACYITPSPFAAFTLTPQPTSLPQPDSTSQKTSRGGLPPLILVAAGIILLAAAGFLYVKMRK